MSLLPALRALHFAPVNSLRLLTLGRRVAHMKDKRKHRPDGRCFLLAPQVGLEPTTLRLTAECSAIELLRNIGIRRRPTLPDRYQSSTIGTEGLNFCVRYGNRWNPFVIATGNGELFISATLTTAQHMIQFVCQSIDLILTRKIKPSTY